MTLEEYHASPFNELHFVNRLERSEIISLINEIMLTGGTHGLPTSSISNFVTDIGLLNELDRCDIDGERYILVYPYNGPKHFEPFKLTDFNMQRINSISGIPYEDYSLFLKKFLTRKFDKTYLEALRAKRNEELEQEIAQLQEYLEPSRN